jgi:hypothetical protein
MSLTLANAISELRYSLNEATAAFWTDAELENWIKEGCRLFSAKTLMVEDTDDIDPLIVSTLYYDSVDNSWIGDMIEPYAAIYFDGTATYKGLIKIHPRQIGNVALSTAGAPKYYCMHNRNIYIFPLVSAAVVTASGTISFLYAKETDAIADITDEYQHLPIIYAAAKAKQKDQKYAESNNLLAQFFQEINFERQDKHSRETDSLDKFKIPGRGGGTESARG